MFPAQRKLFAKRGALPIAAVKSVQINRNPDASCFYDASGAVPVARTDELSMQHVPCSRASAQQRAARRLDYSNTAAMIFGTAPTFDQILVSVTALDTAVNRAVT